MTPSQGGRTSGSHELGGEQVEGRRAVLELLRASRRTVREIVVSADAEPTALLDELFELAEGACSLRRVSAVELESRARTDAPQGVVAYSDPIPSVALSHLAEPSLPGRTAPFIVVVDGVTDPQNLGALLRSALGAGVSGAVLPRHRAVKLTPTVAKAAAGAVEYLEFSLVAGIPAALSDLKRLGFWVVGLDAAGTVDIDALPVAGEPVALVLGAEGRGLAKLVRQRCDVVASIPLLGPVESLNVAAAAAVACFAIARQRRLTAAS